MVLCNITTPPQIGDGLIAYVDLALDLLVYPDGRMLVLDEDEFTALELAEWQQKRAIAALDELKSYFHPLPLAGLLNT